MNTTIGTGSDTFAVIHRPIQRNARITELSTGQDKNSGNQKAEQRDLAENPTPRRRAFEKTQSRTKQEAENENQPSPTHRRVRRTGARVDRVGSSANRAALGLGVVEGREDLFDG
jgi:hypothetical protein